MSDRMTDSWNQYLALDKPHHDGGYLEYLVGINEELKLTLEKCNESCGEWADENEELGKQFMRAISLLNQVECQNKSHQPSCAVTGDCEWCKKRDAIKSAIPLK